MSALGDKQIEDRDRKRQFKQRQGGVVDYADADGDILKAAIAAVGSIGGAIRFGYSRDGGVYAVGVLGDGEPYTLWCKDTAELHGTLRDLADYMQDAPKVPENGHRPKKRA